MLFHDPVFLFLFLPLTFAVWLVADRFSAGPLRWQILILASLIFYGYFRWRYVALLVASMAFNFVLAKLIIEAQLATAKGRARLLLVLAVTVNLAGLSLYKYSDFVVLNVNAALDTKIAPLQLLLPLAISFYTFQQIAYLVDVYRDPRNGVSATEYAFFTSFFPHLIAGPICHSSDIVPQMHGRRTAAETWQDVQIGAVIFVIGLFKKVVISGVFSPMADAGFATGWPRASKTSTAKGRTRLYSTRRILFQTEISIL